MTKIEQIGLSTARISTNIEHGPTGMHRERSNREPSLTKIERSLPSIARVPLSIERTSLSIDRRALSMERHESGPHLFAIVCTSAIHRSCPGVMNGFPVVISPTESSRSGSAHAITFVKPTCPNACSESLP